MTAMRTVLVVEDNRMNRELIRDILEFRFRVVEAESAEVAWELLRGLTPDLVLMDVQLPGMDGLALTRRMKADRGRLAAVPVIVVSAHALPRDIQMARDAGCCDYVTKPITDDPFTFLDRISRAMTPAKEPMAGPAE
jgi:two-component system cell cycle response regulator/two-component system cell cycle response regulator DivK